ncbi:MAG: CopD family protein [Gammaproteobacteria bacterium]|nr:CopD family protein [Gammaproteobacteria bacterium]
MLWIKAFHIIFVVCWFAGLFYLPRLFVYHSMSQDQISIARFQIMERKLFWAIMTPSALATIILGAWLLAANWNYFMASRWMQLKLGFVALLLLQHLYCYWFMIKLRSNAAYKPHAFFRVFNELPVIPLVVIVILVVVKPTI